VTTHTHHTIEPVLYVVVGASNITIYASMYGDSAAPVSGMTGTPGVSFSSNIGVVHFAVRCLGSDWSEWIPEEADGGSPDPDWNPEIIDSFLGRLSREAVGGNLQRCPRRPQMGMRFESFDEFHARELSLQRRSARVRAEFERHMLRCSKDARAAYARKGLTIGRHFAAGDVALRRRVIALGSFERSLPENSMRGTPKNGSTSPTKKAANSAGSFFAAGSGGRTREDTGSARRKELGDELTSTLQDLSYTRYATKLIADEKDLFDMSYEERLLAEDTVEWDAGSDRTEFDAAPRRNPRRSCCFHVGSQYKVDREVDPSTVSAPELILDTLELS